MKFKFEKPEGCVLKLKMQDSYKYANQLIMFTLKYFFIYTALYVMYYFSEII